MAISIILPLHEFIDNVVLRSSLFFYNVDRPNPVKRNHAKAIIHQLVDDALSHSFAWAPSVDKTSGLLEEFYQWMTTHPVFGSRFYQQCIDPVDARLTEILGTYVTYNTPDVWSVRKDGDSIVLENLGSHMNNAAQGFADKLQSLLQEEYATRLGSLPIHRNNATTGDDLKHQVDSTYGDLTNTVLRLMVDKDLNLTGQPQ